MAPTSIRPYRQGWQWRLSSLLVSCVAVAACQVLLVAAHGVHNDGQSPPPLDVTAPAPSVEATSPSLQTSTLIGNKCGAMVVLFVVPFVGTILPYFIRFSLRFLVYGMLYSVGIFFALAIMHLAGDSIVGFQDLYHGSYPFANLLICVGFVLAFLAEVVLSLVFTKYGVGKGQPVAGQTMPGAILSEDPKAAAKKELNEEGCSSSSAVRAMEEHLSGCCGDDCRCPPGECSCPHDPEDVRAKAIELVPGAEMDKPLLRLQALQISFLDCILIFFALCFHAIFEGLAVGLASTVSDVWNTTIPVMLHKFFEGLSLGVSLMVQQPNRSLLSVALYGAAFSMMIPIGIAIGIILDSSASTSAQNWSQAVLNAIAAGIFIYVSLIHIMTKAMRQTCQDGKLEPLFKWSCLTAGVTTFALLEIYSS